jgi:alpha-glucosidase (family GH31 glycosyl hydrolase)
MRATVTADARKQTVRLQLLPAESWWGGAVADGQLMPFAAQTRHQRDLAVTAGILEPDGPVGQLPYAGGNQSAPLLLSDRGRFIWSEQPYRFTVADGWIEAEGPDLVHGRAGDSLADAFRTAAAAFFPPSGRTPALELLKAPQYNTWIEMPFRPTAGAVLNYAKRLLAAGFPPGVLMIDDRWSVDYGTWTFDPVAFPDPAGLVRELHALGFSVMLWLVPFVDGDATTFADLSSRGLLISDRVGRVAIRRWWNGASAVLDAANPATVSWLHEVLDTLVAEVGVDGFKFDGGDLWSYRADDLGGIEPAGQSEAWAMAGLRYPLNEYRACWKMGGQPLAQRLHDKPPLWGAGGLDSLIPDAIAQGLIGHPFVCPDMIGGGELDIFRQTGVDPELFVRYAQCAALFPMMQFSASPPRHLPAEYLAATLAAVQLHQRLVPEIVRLAKHAARTGEPILRPLAYHHRGYQAVGDQFLLGEDILAAPVLTPGATRRSVVFPPGTWMGSDGVRRDGGQVIDIPVSLTSIPWFRRCRAGR